MKNTVRYNFVVQEDLYVAMCVCNKHKHINMDDISLEDAKLLANDTISWLSEQIQYIDVLENFGGSTPNEWAYLYYMMCAYADEYRIGMPTFSHCSKDELIVVANKTVEWLKGFISEMHEPTDNDI